MKLQVVIFLLTFCKLTHGAVVVVPLDADTRQDGQLVFGQQSSNNVVMQKVLRAIDAQDLPVALDLTLVADEMPGVMQELLQLQQEIDIVHPDGLDLPVQDEEDMPDSLVPNAQGLVISTTYGQLRGKV